MSDKGIAPVLFEHEMQATAKIFGRDSKVNVRIGGAKAYTTDKEIVLPAIDHGKPIEDFTAKVARGYVDHEAAHKRYTDVKGGWLKLASQHSPQAEAMLQGIEDPRIEMRAVQDYPGARVNLEAATQAVIDRLVEKGNEGAFKDVTPEQMLPVATAIAGRSEQMGMVFTQLDELKAILPDGVWDKATEIAAKIPQLQSTEDAYNLAMSYVTNDPEQGGGNDGGMQHGGGVDGDGSPKQSRNPMQDELQAALEEMLGGGGSNGQYGGDAPYIANRKYDRIETSAGKTIKMWHAAPELRSEYDNVRAQLGPQVQAVKQAFERGLLVQTTRGWEGGQMQGRIDPRRLSGAVAGAEAVFRKRDQQQDLDVAVSLLVDGSGSMQGSGIATARMTCIALGEALAKLGVPFEVALFRGGAALDGGIIQNEGLTRHQELDYFVLKSFDDRLFDARGGLAQMVRMATNGTPEGCALAEAYLRIKLRNEKRKVIITIVDGGPGVYGHADEGQFLRDIIGMIKQDPSFTLASIGIETAQPIHYYGTEAVAVVESITDLPKVAMAHIKDLLLPKRGARRAA